MQNSHHATRPAAPPPPALRRRVGLVCAAVGWFAIAALTLTPGSGAGPDLPFGCVVCGPDGGIDALANVLLFTPLGVGLWLAGVRARDAILLIAVTTLGVEALQLRLVTGRDTSLGDLVWNTAGGALAYAAGARGHALLRPRPAAAAGLAAAWAGLWLAGTALTAWSLGPALWNTRWVAHVGATVRTAPGRAPIVLDARAGDVALRRTGWLTETAAIRAALLAGQPLAATAVVPWAGAAPVNVVVLTEGPSRHVMAALQRSGRGAAYYFRTRAAALRLRSPQVVLADVFGAPADTVRLAAARRGPALEVEAASRLGVRRRVVPLGPNLGWTLLLPPALSAAERFAAYTAAWIAALVLPLAYWAAQGWRGGPAPRLAAAAALIVPPAAFAALPPLLGTAPVAGVEWLAWAVATALGAAAGRAAAAGGGATRGRRASADRAGRANVAPAPALGTGDRLP